MTCTFISYDHAPTIYYIHVENYNVWILHSNFSMLSSMDTIFIPCVLDTCSILVHVNVFIYHMQINVFIYRKLWPNNHGKWHIWTFALIHTCQWWIGNLTCSKTKQMNTTDDALIRTYVTTRIAEKRKCKKNNKMVPCNKVINICLITT